MSVLEQGCCFHQRHTIHCVVISYSSAYVGCGFSSLLWCWIAFSVRHAGSLSNTPWATADTLRVMENLLSLSKMIASVINGRHYFACIWYGWKLGYWKSGKVRLRALLIISEELDLVRCCWVCFFKNCRQYQLILFVGSLWRPPRLLAYKFKFLPAGQRWSGSHFMPALRCHSESQLHTNTSQCQTYSVKIFELPPFTPPPPPFFFFFSFFHFFLSFFFIFSFCCFCLQHLLESGRSRGSFLFVFNIVYLLLLPVMPVFLWCSCTLLLLSSRN